MKSFVELLVVAEDKANAEDLALAAGKLTPRQVASIPRCIYRYIHPDGTDLPLGETPGEDDISVPDIDALAALAWARARRDDPDILFETVRQNIPVTDSVKIREINRELFYFFTDISREEADALFAGVEDENPPEATEAAENSEAQSDLALQTNSEV